MRYEAHITVEPDPEHTYEDFVASTKIWGWKASRFDHDDVDDIAGKWFISMASDNRPKICQCLLEAVTDIVSTGGVVLRWKLEETIIDSKDEGSDINDLIKLGRRYGE